MKSKRILYVEDVYANQQLMIAYINDYNLICEVASSGFEALEMIKTKQYDLIIMDIQMPGMDGYETVQKVRAYNEYYKNLHIVAFTADNSKLSYERAMEAGFNAHYTKPFVEEDFQQLIKSQLGVTSDQVKDLNLSYYERVFGSDQQKINEFITFFLNDLNAFTDKIMLYFDSGNADKIGREIHKIKPLVKQVNQDELVQLLEAFKNPDLSEEQRKTLVHDIKDQTDILIRKLEGHIITS